jgi:hypothetical protein
MRLGLTSAIAGVAVLFSGIAQAPATTLGVRSPEDEGFGERDEIRQSYTLSPGATVRINDISGPVEIETAAGDTAEVYVVRSARTREELEKKKIVVEHTPSSLAIFTEPHRGVRWDHARVHQRVTLKLPRRVSLQVNDVAGRVRVGQIDGDVRIHDVAGSLEVGLVNGTPHVNDIAGSVRVGVGEVAAEGIQINDIAGRVELLVPSGMNADVDIHDISGSIDVGAANVTVLGKVEPDRFTGRIGGGGPKITINDIAGSVAIRND